MIRSAMYPQHTNNTERGRMEDDRHTFHFAAEYRDRGWNVLPLHGKKPALAGWKDLQCRRPTEDELVSWFIRTGCNLGIITGRISGIVVIDCDSPDEVNYWRSHFPPTPLVVRTGRGGAHFYYQAPPDSPVHNRVRIRGRAIDIRGEGGYVVAPPSRHANGNAYTWECWGDYCLDEVPVADPSWSRGGPLSRPSSGPVTGTIRDPRAYVQRIRAIAGERGHDHTYRVACILRKAGLTPEEALAELMVWNQTNAHPPWTPRELLHKVQSVYRINDSSGSTPT